VSISGTGDIGTNLYALLSGSLDLYKSSAEQDLDGLPISLQCLVMAARACHDSVNRAREAVMNFHSRIETHRRDRANSDVFLSTSLSLTGVNKP